MSVTGLSRESRRHLQDAIEQHTLPDDFMASIETFYLPLATGIVSRLDRQSPTFIGIQGSQGSGKSTCAHFLWLLLQHQFGVQALVMSIDDFYLTRAERQRMAASIHPLFATRGVPGTHDVDLIQEVFDAARQRRQFSVPVFDKSIDDRAPKQQWQRVDDALDVVILEGWCVGLDPQPADKLRQDANELERLEDPQHVWRTTVNEALISDYAPLFAQLELLIALQAPSFDCVYGWRRLQEEKMIVRLTQAGKDTANALSADQLHRFIAHYQRLTEHALQTMPTKADWLLTLNEDHSFNSLDEKR